MSPSLPLSLSLSRRKGCSRATATGGRHGFYSSAAKFGIAAAAAAAAEGVARLAAARKTTRSRHPGMGTNSETFALSLSWLRRSSNDVCTSHLLSTTTTLAPSLPPEPFMSLADGSRTFDADPKGCRVKRRKRVRLLSYTGAADFTHQLDSLTHSLGLRRLSSNEAHARIRLYTKALIHSLADCVNTNPENSQQLSC